jgi:transposase InsO family protein
VHTTGRDGFGVEEESDEEREYALKNSFLLDSAAPIHVCNNYSRFKTFTSATGEDSLRAGSSFTRIEGYGTVEVNAIPATPGDKFCTLELVDVAYVPSFHTSLVSFDRAWSKGIQWDTEKMTLNANNTPLCKVNRMFSQWVLEYNPLSTTDKAVMATRRTTTPRSAQPLISKGSVDLWHRRLAHLGKDMVKKLPTCCEGVRLEETSHEEDSICEVCKLTKAQRQISRRPATRATQLMERVHFDLIQMNTAYNGDNWGLHFLEDFTRMNFAYTYPLKSDTLEMIKDFYTFVETQYQTKIRIFKRDGEQTLGRAYDAWIREKGIAEEISAPYTPEQNGAAERSGGVLIRKARAMRIEGRLPEELWPESFKATAYITNRSPSKALEGMTPHEKLNQLLGKPNPKPNIAHIRVYGCRAYKTLLKISRKRKMAAKASIGYLVGYEASNIFRIWFPRERKVVVSRDVDFDENRRYDPNAPLIEDELVETTPLQRVTVQIPAYKGNLTQFKSLEDEDEDEEDEDSDDQGEESVDTSQVQRIHEAQQLLTPETTPGPSEESHYPEVREDKGTPAVHDHEQHPLKEICGDIDESNIIEGPRSRRPRKEAYLAQLSKPPTNLSGYLAAFTASILDTKKESVPQARIHRDQLPPPPKSWRDLMKHTHKEGFMTAAVKEYNELCEKKTFKEVDRPTDAQIIPLMWTFVYKFDTEGYLTKYKARICARGDLQRNGLQDTYAATLFAKTFRAMMAIAAYFGLEAYQWDIQNAFVNADMDEEVFVEFPDGFKQQNRAILLQKALYGLRRSPRLWQKDFVATLAALGLKQASEDSCVFSNEYIVLLVFVDDIIAFCQPEDGEYLVNFRENLSQKYPMRNLGLLNWFLGVRIIRDRPARKIWLCQDSYIEKIAHRYHLEERKPAITPLPTFDDMLAKYDGKASAQDIHLFQQKVGSIQYTTSITRPDAARAASKLAEHLLNPSSAHMDAADRLISYLFGTRTLAIEYSPDGSNCEFSSDAAFADNEGRKSSEGYLFKMFGGAVDWRATKQKTVTTSTTEAELLAISNAARETFWWKRFFKDIGLELDSDKPTILCDNAQTVGLIQKEEPELKTRLRHVDINHHWVRQESQQHHIHIQWIPTARMPADGLTKSLPRQKHGQFITMLGLIDIRDRIQSPRNS